MKAINSYIAPLLLSVLLCANLFVHAEEAPIAKDTQQIKEVWVYAKKHVAQSSFDLCKINSEQLPFQTLGGSLQANGIAIRSNGAGLLTLAGLRGLYGNQLSLLWEGFNIQSPMNGSLDLNLIPSFLLDYAEVLPNSFSSINGNAALSGSISFGTNSPDFNKQQSAKVHTAFGSFNHQIYAAEYQFAHKKLFSKSRIWTQSALNNYPIIGYENTPFKTVQNNNDNKSTAFTQEFAFALPKNQLLIFKSWFHMANRGLVDAVHVPNPKSRQEDRVLRLMTDWKFGKKHNYSLKTAFFDEYMVFIDNSNTYFHNNAQSFILEFAGMNVLNQKFNLRYGVNQTFNTAKVLHYNGTKSQNLLAAFASIHFEVPKHAVDLSVRQQVHNKILEVPTPSLAYQYKFNKFTSLNLSSGYSLRVPTFNDRFWNPGGNINLLNETAFKNEIAFKVQRNRLSFNLSVYHNRVSNLIVWLPHTNNFVEARNLRKAHITGAELQAVFMLYKTKDSKINLHFTPTLNFSQYAAAELGNEGIIGNQLIFIPVEMGNAYLQATHKSWSATFLLNYTGDRYIYTDNSSALHAFYLVDLQLNKKWYWKQLAGRFGAAFNNILNAHYELFPARPMPGRNMQLNLSIYIN